MSIKSTQYISRSEALKRLSLVSTNLLKQLRDDKKTSTSFLMKLGVIEKQEEILFTQEEIEGFLTQLNSFDNETLGNILDTKHFRNSEFENYLVIDD